MLHLAYVSPVNIILGRQFLLLYGSILRTYGTMTLSQGGGRYVLEHDQQCGEKGGGAKTLIIMPIA